MSLKHQSMIKGGYILIPKDDIFGIDSSPYYVREILSFLMKTAKFKDTQQSGFTVKRGQLFATYQGITDALKWRVGNRFEKYTRDQVHKAFKILRKQGIITTKKKARGVLVTICNYNHFQDWKNYESHTESHLQNPELSCNNDELQEKKMPESHSESHKNGAESHSQSHSESHLRTIEFGCDNSELECQMKSESHSESHSTAPSIIEYTPGSRDIVSIITCTREGKICPPPQTDDCDFDRDRKIFFDAFSGVKTIQTFDDDANRKSGALVKLVHVSGEIPYNYTSRLEQLNEQGAGVYLTVNETNGQGRKAGDIVRVRAVFADLDGSPIDPVWDYAPSLVVESSPGKYHAYWLTVDDPVDGVPLDGFRQIQESIAEKFGSDPKVKDLPRVMRIPGFNHRKKEPFLSRIIHYTGARYTYADLVEMFPPAPRDKWSAPKYQTPTTLNPDTGFKGAYGTPQGGRNNHIAARIGGMIKRGLSWSEIEAEAHREGAACAPPLSGREVEAVLRSMRRYA